MIKYINKFRFFNHSWQTRTHYHFYRSRYPPTELLGYPTSFILLANQTFRLTQSSVTPPLFLPYTWFTTPPDLLRLWTASLPFTRIFLLSVFRKVRSQCRSRQSPWLSIPSTLHKGGFRTLESRQTQYVLTEAFRLSFAAGEGCEGYLCLARYGFQSRNTLQELYSGSILM